MYEGYRAEFNLTSRENEVLGAGYDSGAVEPTPSAAAEFGEFRGKIEAGRAVGAKAGRYADWLVSTMNIKTPGEQEAAIRAVPDPHPFSAKPLKNGPFLDDTFATAKFIALLKCVQHQKCRAEGYLKKKVKAGSGAPAIFKVRF